jgi:hypothetical protein
MAAAPTRARNAKSRNASRRGGSDAARGWDRGVSPTVMYVGIGALLLVVGVVIGALLFGSKGSSASKSATNKSANAASETVTNVSLNAAGPARMDAGLPVGFAHTSDGAIAAAAAYSALNTEMLFRTEADVRSIARRMATTSAADAVEQAVLAPFRGTRQGLAAAGLLNPKGKAMLRSVPIGNRLVSYSPAVARVDVWNVGLVAIDVAESQPTALWQTTSFELAWQNDDWKVSSVKVADGPAPAATKSVPSVTADFLAQAETLKSFVYLPRTEK